jgi:hypothetical protein
MLYFPDYHILDMCLRIRQEKEVYKIHGKKAKRSRDIFLLPNITVRVRKGGDNSYYFIFLEKINLLLSLSSTTSLTFQTLHSTRRLPRNLLSSVSQHNPFLP